MLSDGEESWPKNLSIIYDLIINRSTINRLFINHIYQSFNHQSLNRK